MVMVEVSFGEPGVQTWGPKVPEVRSTWAGLAVIDDALPL